MPNTRSMLWRFGVSAILVAAAAPAPAHGQGRVELIPFVGSYYALSALGLAAPDQTERQENQPAFGAALLLRLSQTLGIEGSVAYTPSGTNITSTTVANRGFSGSVLFANARARLWLSRTNLYGLAGLGIVARGGEAWDFAGLDQLTSIAGAVGVGAQAEVSPSVRVDLKIEVQVYPFDPDGDGTQYEHKTLADVIATVGIPIRIAGR